MTKEMKLKAAHSLLKMRTQFDQMFPKIFVCGKKSCPFVNPLHRIMGGGNGYTIEVLTIQEAFLLVLGREMNATDFGLVDWNINQQGATYDGFLYCEFKPFKPIEQPLAPLPAPKQEEEEVIVPDAVDEEKTKQESFEKQMLIEALEKNNNVKTKTAIYLGMTVSKLQTKLNKYNIIIEKK